MPTDSNGRKFADQDSIRIPRDANNQCFETGGVAIAPAKKTNLSISDTLIKLGVALRKIYK